ncbi:hypothetical protein EGI22_12575, partial [Lacihabitans sp. LS3-19]|uniref:hypothetical protein n=1 Tax=Lacihabitans sp. LS3-19 TaxID=2487335 RepID=UPI0020CCB73A
YELTGAHANVSNCMACHKGPANQTPTDCNSCHNGNYTGAKNPDHAAIGLSTDCATCHTTAPGWRPTSFNHDNYYVLTGGHAVIAANCTTCHKGGNISNTPTDCNSCHNAKYTGAKNPDHAAIGLSTDCATCHTTAPGWRPTSFNHDNYYVLTGGHAVIAANCTTCHKGGNISNTPTDCNSCHNAKYNATTNPNHKALGFPTDCAQCHTTAPGWSPSTFDHGQFYPLTGAHDLIKANCLQCHVGGKYSGTPTDCNSCHNAAFNGATSPNHKALGISTDCASCHTTNPGWRPSTFNHNNYYVLTGAHANIASNCASCHKGGDIKNTPTDCNGCHNANYVSTSNPNHGVLGLSTDCASCHTTAPGWKPTSFNHNNFYALTGAHANIASNCAACHKGNANQTPTDCNSCHNANYTATTNPNHALLGLSTDCASCHTTAPGWKPTSFNHTNFYELTGAHANIASNCMQCHKGPANQTPTDCNSCHNAAYNGAKNPNHATSGFSTDCASCHSTTPGWRPSTFDHSSFYPLTGAHATVSACTQCHIGGNFNNTPTDCNSCHNAAYKSAANPNHTTVGLSTDCASCHTTTPGWRPSTFNHSNYFALTGAHANIASNCVQCHNSGNVSNTPTDCNSCHNAAYQGAKNPNHVSASFSTDCASCHTTNPGWRPSTFNHNNFYVLEGAHAAIANNCTQCHIGGNYNNTPNTCYGCHSDKYNTAKPSHASSGFPTSCTDCHSQNSWKPANWDHDAMYFRIYSGKHKGEWNNDCTQCHTTPNNFSIFNCLNCHKKSKTDSNHKDVKNYVYESNACLSCHPRV